MQRSLKEVMETVRVVGVTESKGEVKNRQVESLMMHFTQIEVAKLPMNACPFALKR